MIPHFRVDLLSVLVSVATFLDVAFFFRSSAHRPVTSVQVATLVSVNLALIGVAVSNLVHMRRQRAESPRFELRRLMKFSSAGLGLLAVALHVTSKLQYLDLVPRWDAGTYFGEIVRAVENVDLSLSSIASEFQLAGHPSQAYGMYLAIGQMLFRSSQYAMNFQNMLLAGVGVYCFWLLVQRLLAPLGPWHHFLLTLLFAFNPLFYGNSIHINADFPVTVSLLLVLTAFVLNRPLLFSFGGILLVFSKEPGSFLYALLLFLLVVFFALPRSKSLADFVLGMGNHLRFSGKSLDVPERLSRSMCRTGVVFGLALLPLLLFYAYHKSLPQQRWTSSASIWNDRGVLCFGLNSIMIRNVLYEALVMNFGWIMTLVGFAYFARRQIWGTEGGVADSVEARRVIRIVAYLYLSYLTLHCLYINFLNPRYVAPLVPLGILVFGSALSRLIRRSWAQLAILSTCVGLSVIQTWRAVDPVSNRLWGTFTIGNQSLVHVGGDLQGMADGMVYNAQFASLERLYRAINHWALPKRPEILVFGSSHYWLLYYNLGAMRVDTTSGKLTSKVENSAYVAVVGIDDLEHHPPYNPAVYVAMPWMEDVSSTLKRLQRLYVIKGSQRIRYGEYFVDAYELERIAPNAS